MGPGTANLNNMRRTSSATLGLSVLLHNDISFVNECLESISREWQGAWRDVNILVSGSTDGTDQFVSDWVNARAVAQRPVLEVSEMNLGPMGGLIRLLQMSLSTHTAVLHGDDVLLEGFYTSLSLDSEGLDAQTVVVRDLTILSRHENSIWLRSGVLKRVLVSRSTAWNRYAMSVFNIAGMPGSLVPVAFCLDLLSTEQLPPLLCAEDWYLFTRVLSSGGNLQRSARATYGYRLHEESTTHSALQPYSVGFIRGRQQRQPNLLLRRVARLQTARERSRFYLKTEYDRGLRDGLGRRPCGNSRILDQSPLTALPFLISLRIVGLLRGLTSS